ncbi:Glutamate receptor 2.2 [Camellia lanceoleosa]|uniref:Glutamate receptor 2.2 n=1 Tax=Camellia lanceoleosa TaxID=1840588 RepID=A0ACC0GZV5_9ERIC|nr:Glutamate receptor 2.2 [Camellia lanceoleosa]
MKVVSHLLFSVLALVFLLLSQLPRSAYGGTNMAEQTNHVKKSIVGAIVDFSSRIGREEKVAMELAIDDFYFNTNISLILEVRDSGGDPIQAAHAATNLINTHHVQAILGPRTWEEASLVSEIGSQTHTPILSFADSPPWATTRWPFLLQASPSPSAQMKAVAAIVQSWGWRQVNVIYEDTNSAATGVIPHLHHSLQEAGAQISHLVGLPFFASSTSFSPELEKLKKGQCRFFVVHTSFPLAIRLFKKANKMGMMERDYVWIITDPIANLVHAINSFAIASMQGVLGVRTYFNEAGSHYHHFYTRFTRRFGLENPDEENHEPGIFALQAYDATRLVATAMTHNDNDNSIDNIVLTEFDGLSGESRFIERKVAPVRTFQIINVIGKSYREIGFWSDGFGFSGTVDGGERYNDSMESLKMVIWPGEPRIAPKGWTLPTRTNRLRIGVPKGTLFNLFLRVEYDEFTRNYSISGFSVDVFNAIIERLPYNLSYDLFPYEGLFDDLVEQVYLKKFDAALGAIAITAKRYHHVDFSQPYTDAALVMIVPVQSQLSNKAWLFLKPFTKSMWVLTASINVYNGFVIWMIERDRCSDLRGSALNQIGTLLWLTFATLFSLNGEKLHSKLSRMATVVWLFVALVITQSYTANLTSMLTVPRLEPTVADIETLKYNNAMVGCTNKSFVANYLGQVLNFSHNCMKHYNRQEEIAQALRTKEIAAAFLDAPVAKLFLARYCKSFIRAGPTYKIGGYGFVFPKGSPILSDINEALAKVIDTGKLRELEDNMASTESCVDVDPNSDTVMSLCPNSFFALFILTGGTSTFALLIYVVVRQRKLDDSMREHKTNWILMFAFIKCWLLRRKRFSTRVTDAEIPRSSAHAGDSWTPL